MRGGAVARGGLASSGEPLARELLDAGAPVTVRLRGFVVDPLLQERLELEFEELCKLHSLFLLKNISQIPNRIF